MHPRVKDLLERHQTLFLDLNPGAKKDPRAIGLDRRPFPGIEIVHDIEDVPWPLPDGCCYRILATHVVEFVKPWLIHAVMDECWRLLQDDGQLLLATVYANSARFWANPRHTHAWNEATPLYFCCGTPLWQEEQPRCWTLEAEFPQWQSDGNLQVIFNKKAGEHAQHVEGATIHGGPTPTPRD